MPCPVTTLVKSGSVATAAVVAVSLLVAPAVHLVAPTDGWADLSAARALDVADATAEGWGASAAGERVSELLRGSGLTMFNPEGWHGPDTWTTSGSSSSGFFEGWYYKLVTSAGRTVVLIPGAVYPRNGSSFSFVMVADPDAGSSESRVRLFRYPTSALKAARGDGDGQWSLRVGESTFGPNGLTVSLRDPDTGDVRVSGTISLSRSVRWPATVLYPDVSGWFAWVPGMECRHGVVSLRSEVAGELAVNGESVGFGVGGGTAYVEKDWGSTFPKTWVWLQSSDFECGAPPGPGCRMNASLFLAVASVPFPSDRLELIRFRGLIGGLWLNGTLHRFGTYNGAVIERLEPTPGGEVALTLRSAQHRIDVRAKGDPAAAAVLFGPVPGGDFVPFVREMLGAELAVRLTRRSDGEVLFDAVGRHAGLEIESIEDGGLELLR